MKLIHADCLTALRDLGDNTVDAIVTDPPYGLSFMGKRWDYDVPAVEVWAECLRVLKPGGHLLAFAGTRTQHRMAVRIEDAGFEIRDMIAWVYGSGFPKSLDVSKAIDKVAGAKRESRVNERWADKYPNGPGGNLSGDGRSEHYNQAKRIIGAPLMTSSPSTSAARQWSGWGTALKPALEPITLARKPLIGTVAENVLAHGTGALNIDGCRVEGVHGSADSAGQGAGRATANHNGNAYGKGLGGIVAAPHAAGRWPANLIHDGSEEVVAGFPETASGEWKGQTPDNSAAMFAPGNGGGFKAKAITWPANSGSASRFFYCAKASRREREAGLAAFQSRLSELNSGGIGRACSVEKRMAEQGENAPAVRNHHPTVKPIALMRYLCRLITPPSGVVLDPFMGSGTTGIAAKLEGFDFIGIEREAEYIAIAEARIAHWESENNLFGA